MESTLIINERKDGCLPISLTALLPQGKISSLAEMENYFPFSDFSLAIMIMEEGKFNEMKEKIATLSSKLPILILGQKEGAHTFADYILDGKVTFLSDETEAAFLIGTCKEIQRLFRGDNE